MTDFFLVVAAVIFGASPFALAWVMVTQSRGSAGLAIAKEETERLRRTDYEAAAKRLDGHDVELQRAAADRASLHDAVKRADAKIVLGRGGKPQ